MMMMHQGHLPRLLMLNQDIINNYSPPPDSSLQQSSAGNGNGNGNGNGGDSDFDSNMVIILAALLCALICALGLNSIVRCALRCSRRFALETNYDDHGDGNVNVNVIASAAGRGVATTTTATATAATATATATGLKKDALKQIPVVVYNSSSGVNIPATECPICLAEFSQGDKVRILPGCNHGFHLNCIDTWLLSHSSCPTCRQLILFQPSPTTTTAT